MVRLIGFMAQLVAKGDTQIYGLEYEDTFSYMAKTVISPIILFKVVTNHQYLYQLHGDSSEEVYLEQLPTFVVQGESLGLVCHLRKFVYGLEKSPKAWFGKFNIVVQQFSMNQSEITTQFSIAIHMQRILTWLYKLMTLLLQVVITIESLNKVTSLSN